jgi:hypothetical protein
VSEGGEWRELSNKPPYFYCDSRFAEVEAVAVLTTLISHYTIHLTNEMEAEFKVLNLSTAQKTRRLLKSKLLFTTTYVLF